MIALIRGTGEGEVNNKENNVGIIGVEGLRFKVVKLSGCQL